MWRQSGAVIGVLSLFAYGLGHFSAPASVPAPPPPANGVGSMSECAVCREDKPASEFPSNTPSDACVHQINICSACIMRHIEREVNGKGEVLSVGCPDCLSTLSFDEVKRGASQSVFERQEKYDTLLLRKQLQSLPDFRWCKNAECGSGQIHDGGVKNPIMRCPGCNALSCFRHDLPWHYEKTCEEMDAELEKNLNDVASRAYIDSTTKPCPQCREPIEKDGGCDHMTCRRPAGCGYEFCWLCLAPYEKISREGNHHHRATCQYYAAYDRENDD